MTAAKKRKSAHPCYAENVCKRVMDKNKLLLDLVDLNSDKKISDLEYIQLTIQVKNQEGGVS